MFKAAINPSIFVLSLKNEYIDMKKMVSMGKREPPTGEFSCAFYDHRVGKNISPEANANFLITLVLILCFLGTITEHLLLKNM